MAKKSTYETAISILSRRLYSEYELRAKLFEKELPPREIYETIDRLKNLNMLNDEQFTLARIRYRAEVSKWGRSRIKIELKSKGIDDTMAENLLSKWENGETKVYGVSDDVHNWESEAAKLLWKKFGIWKDFNYNDDEIENLDSDEKQQAFLKSQKDKKRRLDFLLRRGFSIDESLKAFEAVKLVSLDENI